MGNVKTTNTALFDDGNGFNFVMASSTKRTFGSFGDSVDHATHLIADGSGDEFLICRVVGRVRKKPIPIEVIEF